MNGKNVVRKRDPTKGGKLSFPTEISYRQSRLIHRTNNIVTKTKIFSPFFFVCAFLVPSVIHELSAIMWLTKCHVSIILSHV